MVPSTRGGRALVAAAVQDNTGQVATDEQDQVHELIDEEEAEQQDDVDDDGQDDDEVEIQAEVPAGPRSDLQQFQNHK